ncbi:putative glucokinase regulator family protein [Aspergillus lucknowensis]|uniref:N-acetyl-D-glucosamine kinase n=1 Tax=Aspergillus lucknowensis TaxID=176173 RepID=A0ABR4LVP8_9EURO
MDLENLAHLQTEAVNPSTTQIDQISTLEMCVAMNREDHRVAPSIVPCLPQIAAAIDAFVPRVQRGGRVIYVGAGTSGRLGILDASEIPPTFAAPPGQFVGLIAGGDAAIRRAQEGAEDSEALAVADMLPLDLNPELDSIIGIAASGRTPYVLECLEIAKRIGCVTVGVACADPSAMSRSGVVDFLIAPLPGPEVVTGSTRLKAGTATKLVLNMLSTGTMIRIGKTYGNMMVDLVASNAKLRQRSRNILRRLSIRCASLSDTEIDDLLGRCNQSVKLALLVAETGNPVEQCRHNLEVASQRLAHVLVRNRTISRQEKLPLVLCIDGGGTKCAAVIADRKGTILGRGLAGPCNLTDGNSLDDAIATLAMAVQGALKSFQTPATVDNGIAALSRFESVWIGLAGMDRPGLRDALASKIASITGASAPRLTNDVDLLAAAMSRHPDVQSAIVLIAGTGSVAMRYNIRAGTREPRRVARSGGWGHLLGDEGGGYVIGVEAIKQTMRALEDQRLGLQSEDLGRLEQAVLAQFGASSTGDTDLLSAVLLAEPGQSVKARIAAVAQLVLDMAPSDPSAMSIVSGQVTNLVGTVLGRLINARCATAVPAAETGLILCGGILTQETYRELVLGRLSELGHHFAYVESVTDAGTVAAQFLASSPSRTDEGQEDKR